MKPDVNILPKYTKKEEIINSITHLVGLVFALGVLTFFIIFSMAKNLDFSYMLPYYVYVLSMMIVFGVSTAYHSSKFSSKTRAVLRVIDHSDIYFFVFGTYFPLCLYAISNQPIATTILILQIIIMILGIVLSVIPCSSKILDIISYVIYIVDGWMIIFFYPFGIGMEFLVFLFVLLGGFTYSLGAITYVIGSKRKYFHSIFHVFVVLAAVLQFIGIYFLLVK